MADFNYLIPRQIQPQPPVDLPGALLKGFAGPLALSGQITQNQLAQEKLKQFQDTRNALAQYAQTQDPGAIRGVDPELYMKVKTWTDSQPPEVLRDLPRATAVAQQIAPMLNSAAWKGGLRDKFVSAFPNLPSEAVPGPDATDAELFQWANTAKILDATLKRQAMEPKVVKNALVSPTGQILYKGPEEKTTLIGPGGVPVGSVAGKVTQLHQPPQPNVQFLENEEGQLVPVDVKNLPLGQPLIGFKKPTTSANMVTAEDTDALIQGIKEGTIDPNQLSKRGLNPVLAKAQKAGVNVAQARLDWKAAERMASTMNSTQMVRFDTLSQTVAGTIDRVIDLSKQMKMSGVPLYNAAKLAEVKNLEGNSPKGQLIGQYMAALTTLKEEYANFAQGGYAPTESAFKLSNDLINQNYGSKQLEATLLETKRLVNIRREAFKNVQTQKVVGPGGISAPGATQQYTLKKNGVEVPVDKATYDAYQRKWGLK